MVLFLYINEKIVAVLMNTIVLYLAQVRERATCHIFFAQKEGSFEN